MQPECRTLQCSQILVEESSKAPWACLFSLWWVVEMPAVVAMPAPPLPLSQVVMAPQLLMLLLVIKEKAWEVMVSLARQR